MKAIVLRHPGTAEVLSYEEVPTPQVRPGWSLMQVRGFGINRSEIFTRNGWSPSVKLPRILGIEGVGTIAETTDPKRLPVGQKVVTLMGGLGRQFDGSYAEYALVPNAQLYPVTTDLPWADLAAIPETWFTAYGSLLKLHLTPEDTLLVRGATSGVGVAVVKLAKAMGVSQVIGTTRNLAKAEPLKAVGFDQVVQDVDNHLNLTAVATKGIELIGPLTMRDTLQAMQPDSILCVTGELGGVWSTDFDPIATLPVDGYLTAFSSESITEAKLQALLNLIATHQLDVTPEQVFDLAHTADAQAYLDSAHSFGKVVVLN